MNRKIDILKQIYFDSRHPAGYGGVRRLYQHSKKLDPNITVRNVKDWLSSQSAYTLFKEAKTNFKRNRIYATHANEQWEIDLLDYAQYARYNRVRIKRNYKYEYRSIKYLITIVDVFSKYAYILPIESKSMNIICNNFEQLFKKVLPKKIRTDRGKEFDNVRFKTMCDKYNIIHFVTQNSTKKCAIVERFNRTMRNKIERFMHHSRTRRYVDDLKSLLFSYNNSFHRSIKMIPSNVSHENEGIVFRNLYGKKNMLEILKDQRYNVMFEIGDTVRQKFEPKVFDKGYRQKWTDVVYKVRQVLNKFIKPQFILEYRGQPFKTKVLP